MQAFIITGERRPSLEILKDIAAFKQRLSAERERELFPKEFGKCWQDLFAESVPRYKWFTVKDLISLSKRKRMVDDDFLFETPRGGAPGIFWLCRTMCWSGEGEGFTPRLCEDGYLSDKGQTMDFTEFLCSLAGETDMAIRKFAIGDYFAEHPDATVSIADVCYRPEMTGEFLREV